MGSMIAQDIVSLGSIGKIKAPNHVDLAMSVHHLTGSKELITVLSRMFVCGISLTSGQLFSELFPDCTRSCFSQVVSRRRGGDRIYEMRCLFVAVGPNARL